MYTLWAVLHTQNECFILLLKPLEHCFQHTWSINRYIFRCQQLWSFIQYYFDNNYNVGMSYQRHCFQTSLTKLCQQNRTVKNFDFWNKHRQCCHRAALKSPRFYFYYFNRYLRTGLILLWLYNIFLEEICG